MSEVKVPELAESISKERFRMVEICWNQVEQGKILLNLKQIVNVEVISEVSGVLSEIKAEE